MTFGKPARIIIALIIVFIMYIFHIYTGGNFVKWNNNKVIGNNVEDAYKAKFNIVVKEKFIDTPNHANETIRAFSLLTNKEELIYGEPGYWELYRAVSVGDTVIKKERSYEFQIRNGNTKKFNMLDTLKWYYE